MKQTIKELKELHEMLEANISVDWNEADASEEFSVLASKLGEILKQIKPKQNGKERNKT
jgi:hypothetical protein